MPSKDVTISWTAFCAIRPTADSAPSLEYPRYAVPKCLAEANEKSLDQVVDDLSRICGTIKERRRRRAAILDASRDARRKEERRCQRMTAGAAIAGTKTALLPVNQPPPNLRPERESPAPTLTGADDPTSLDKAVWEDESTPDWGSSLNNDVSSLPGGKSVQVDARVKGPQPQPRLRVIIEPRAKFNFKRGVDIVVPRGIQ